jgi:hypothetical protein
MRLTLRTLLAYLDGILDSGNAQELGKKVEESDYAVGLVDRLRDVMRRLRLGAPSLTDRGPGLDPNTVAEYLDNTLAADRVTDFEKVCLDSDIHLAEVASCHQILTLVLGEPAEVDPASRQRMYDIQESQSGAKPPPTPTGSAAPALPTVAPLSLDLEIGDGESGDRRPRPKSTVPEYLREPHGRRAWMTAAAAVAITVCVLVVVLKLFGQFEPGSAGGNLLAKVGLVAAAPKEKELARTGDGVENGDVNENKDGGKDVKEPAPAAGSATDNVKTPTTDSGTQPTGKAATEPKTSNPAESGTAPKSETKTTAKSAVPPKTDDGTAVEPKATTPKVNDGKTAPKATAVPPVVAATKSGEESKDGGHDVPPPPEPLGRLLSSEQVLLFNHPVNGWTRVAANQMLLPQQLLALPTYRAKVVLTAGVAVEILGGTRVELLASSPQDLPGIRVLYGRVVLMPLAKAGTRVRVVFGDHSGTLTFVDADSTAAFEVRNLHAPGTNPEETPPNVAANLFVATGTVLWEEMVKGKAEKPVRLTPPQRLEFDGPILGTPVAGRAAPEWITVGEAIKQLDRRASAVISQMLPTDRPARVGLLELTTSRPQKEVKSLSLRCLSYVGQFRDMVAALNEQEHKPEWWDFYVPELRAAVARDSETAAAVRLSLEKQYPQQWADMYRMLFGFTNQQLEAGDDRKLVLGLKNDDVLAVRVLSYWNLKDITGRGEIYQPEQPPARRQSSVRRWEQRLEAKEIRFPTTDEKPAPAARAPATRMPQAAPMPPGEAN